MLQSLPRKDSADGALPTEHRSKWLVLRLFYLLVYYALVLLTSLSTALSCVSQRFVANLSALLHLQPDHHEKPKQMPNHVAISCPCIPDAARPALASIILFLYARGVSHVSVFDPAAPIRVAPLLADLSARLNPRSARESSSNSSSSEDEDTDDEHRLSVRVRHIGTTHTYESTVTLPLRSSSTEPPRKKPNDNLYNCPHACPPNQPTPNQPPNCLKSDIDISDTLAWGGEAPTAKRVEPLLKKNDPKQARDNLHLTLLNPNTSRSSIVRATKHLIRSGAAKALSIEQVVEFLDGDPVHANLPSEPDVLIVFPNANAPPIPVLHDFPVWQLRLTQIVFSQAQPQSISRHSLIQMLSSAAKAPKRFGR